jgi:hypothetical protein
LTSLSRLRNHARARARGGPLPARHEKLMADMLGGGAGDVAQSSADLHP